jgi:GNAT superfamily N-acetyltransferase
LSIWKESSLYCRSRIDADANRETDEGMTGSVRMASLQDAEKITTLINSAFRPAEGFFLDADRIGLESVRGFFLKGKFLLVEGDGVVAACVYVELRGERAYLGLLAVDPARQHCGFGSLLMDAAEETCRGLGCRFMDIQVVNLREDLFGFYRRRGYVETGTHPFPKDVETKLPCHFIVMSKPLAPA